MAFKGTLKEFKVPDILQWFSLQGKTGILTFTKDEGFITLIFENGMIVGVDAFPKKLEMRVGNVLVKQDLISEEMLTRALAIQKRTKQKIGEVLVSMGLVEEQTVEQSLRTQAIEIVMSLFRWKKGDYDFKVMERLDPTMKVIDPMPTDNVIMEGVQMLDEWPMIKKAVPDDYIVFEPVPVETKTFEIVDDDEDEMPKSKNGKIFLSETEADMLKYINGKNSVRDLVELGLFTEYKIYKGLFNLVKKSIIKAKVKSKTEALKEEKLVEELIVISRKRIDQMFYALLVILLLIFLIRFFEPMSPIKSDNVLIKTDLLEATLSTPEPMKK